jgi:hypothetical protein
MNPLINTVKELLVSKDKDNMAIASEILKRYPMLIDITFKDRSSYLLRLYGNGMYKGYDNFGNPNPNGFPTAIVNRYEQFLDYTYTGEGHYGYIK